MRKNYFFIYLILFITPLISNSQTTVKFQSFESGSDDWNYTITPATYNISGDVWALVSSLGGSVNGPQDGSIFWGMRDLDNTNGGGSFNHTIAFDNVDISSSTGVNISFYYITDGFDSTDNISVEIFHDDVSQGVTDLNKNTDTWTEFTASVPDTVNNVRVTIIASQNGGTDYAGVDNFRITEASTNPSVSFDNSTSNINETNSTVNTLIPVTFNNYSSDVTVGITVDPSSSAQAGDYTLNTNSLSFTGNGTQNISLDINNDADFINETVILNLTVSSGSADIITSQHTVTINDDDIPLVINEIHADPDATNGDANGDGTVNTSQDEFIEIYNISGSDLDISGWVVADAVNDRHTFPSNTIIPANESIVVFGGGTPVTVPGLVQTSSSSTLGLNNGGDSIIIKNDTGITIISESYGSEGGNNQSIARNDDLVGTFIQHSNIVSNPVLFSPGRDNTDNTPFSSSIKWTGVTNNDWNTATNWLGGVVPSGSSDVIIPAGLTNYPTASSFIFVNSITFESGTSLLFNSFVNGQITYNRNVTSNWHLVASPIDNETINNLISNNDFSTGTSTNIGIGLYDNNNATTPWQYQNNSSTGALTSGTGISVKLNTSPMVFKGNMYTGSDLIPITTGSRTDFNLIGNRYTAYLDSNAFLTNITNTPALAEQTIWLWDGTQYVTKNLAESIKIAPTQAFFIRAAINTNVALNPAMLSHNSTDTFLRQTPKSSFELFVNNGETEGSTKVFYIDGKTKGFDNGYDSRIFEGVNQKFAVFTELLNNNDGRKLAIQTLPNNNHETMIIPVGLTAEAGEEIIFSIKENNLLSGINIYLEDRVNNTFVNLSENNHKVTLKEASNGTGQYYIHATSSRLSNEEITNNFNNVSIYKSASQELTVTGLQGKASVKVFSILGKEINNTIINSNGKSKINLPKLSSGVYIVRLSSDLGKLTKKIILE
ncbi:lamin tail domain-containing protein [Tenacibaculum sp. ZS6-P6]|uniref:lamin tail domain-containing protein n=1 Tax=Tenacibaculum sp. ZS6-P6 TaxID=3447503 RepID=UPI003F99A24A